MKKIIALVLSVMMLGLLAGCGSTETKAPAPKKIVIGLDDSFPPMGFRDEKNNIVGFDVDMAREAAKRLGLEVEFKAIDWSSKEAELNGKRIDALWNGMNITEERKKNVLFSEPYMESKQLIFVLAGSPIKSAADLAGKAVGVQQASIAEEVVTKDVQLKNSLKDFKQYPDFIAAFMDLKTGRLDAVITDEILGRYYLSKEAGQYVAIDQPLGEVGVYGVGFRKEDKKLRDKVQAILDEMKKDGTSAKISKQWFGEDIVK
ncbi:transporter substrate-binding domain-containing protein|uniref:Amino acid ABC transporter substrate-binding protein, PAAT family n=1 Tax=Dendrosporobacter quercicolus TaxID=146817 RepID=A0A1G9SQU7_9FIRM|nr:amino acid ABC transporter substrate-binding protein [Dendrosporobacter quercicolus]NSL48646.1 transporter substrate-binding domain-containing protein [Dendrosporobacter quercicolus DSM 1736]SDM37744.1 amino acid ABC transporter substrate-binding protein, PAAT family [Dendrosporobacter quercicolus]